MLHYYEPQYLRHEYQFTENKNFELYYGLQQQQKDLEIDVCPKRKKFMDDNEKMRFVENYTRKIKTELCKNYVLAKYCKFGSSCSFAHGEEELTNKVHLHEKFKTKPCQNYFNLGCCNYGIRCQYLHDEIKDNQKYWPFLHKNYKENNQILPIQPQKLDQNERFDVQRFQNLQKKYKLETDLVIIPSDKLSFTDQLNLPLKTKIIDKLKSRLKITKRLETIKEQSKVKVNNIKFKGIDNSNSSDETDDSK